MQGTLKERLPIYGHKKLDLLSMSATALSFGEELVVVDYEINERLYKGLLLVEAAI